MVVSIVERLTLSYGVEEYSNGVWSYGSNCARESSCDERSGALEVWAEEY
jgi:hypothetical protein